MMKSLVFALIIVLKMTGTVVSENAQTVTYQAIAEQDGITITAEPIEELELGESYELDVTVTNNTHNAVYVRPRIVEYYWVGIVDYAPKVLYLAPGESKDFTVYYFAKRVGDYYEITVSINAMKTGNLGTMR